MTEVDLNDVRASVEILRFAEAKMAELKELQKQARAAIEAAMGEAEIGMLDGEAVVNWPHFKTNRFDQSAFAQEYPDLYEQFKAAKEQRRFEIV